MFRKYLTILIVFVALIFQGCAAFKYLDNSSEEEIKRFHATKADLWNENTKLKSINKQLQAQIRILRQENEEIKQENNNGSLEMRNQVLLLQDQTKKLEEENQRLLNENLIIQRKLDDFRLNHETSLSKMDLIKNKSEESVKDINNSNNNLHIKVLNGNGKRYAAKKMAKKLRKMGYQIRLIDNAPRFNFSKNTVFFGSKFQNEAKLLISRLGNNSISKPLTWPSIFDFIVVTGRTR